MRRLLSIISAAVLGLVLLAWPYSFIGSTCIIDRPKLAHWEFGLAESCLWAQSSMGRKPRPLERDHYYFTGGVPRDGSSLLWPQAGRAAAGTFTAVMPLPFVGAVSGLVLSALVMLRIATIRRRRRRSQCLACGYQRHGDGPCQECGLTPAQAAANERARPRRTLQGAAAVMISVLFLLSFGAWLVARAEHRSAAVSRAEAFNYAWYLEQCTPKLDGSVAYATPGSGPTSLGSVLARCGPGTTIVLLPGEHDLGGGSAQPTRAAGLQDVWLLGCGRDTTTLSLHLFNAERIRLENLTIDCRNDPFVDIRSGGSVHLRNCLVKGYNSGAGGSSALDAADSVVLVEQCEFEGKSGRNSPQSHGTAMDLRGDSRVFVRDTVFTNNQEVFRNASGVLDGCTATTDQPQWFWPPNGTSLIQRNVSLGKRTPAAPPVTFSEALDDIGPLTRLGNGEGVRAWGDPFTREQARALGVARDNRFWARLLLHPSPQIRALAKARTPATPSDPPTLTLEEALQALSKPTVPREASLTILANRDAALAPLNALRSAPANPAQSNAAALFQLLDAQPPLPDQVAAAAPLKP